MEAACTVVTTTVDQIRNGAGLVPNNGQPTRGPVSHFSTSQTQLQATGVAALPVRLHPWQTAAV